MTVESFATVVLPLRDLRIGPVRLSAYGACAAAGVLCAMGLAGRTAKRLRLDPECAWDAGLFAILSCFAASRLLLVVSDPKAFLRYPLLVLSLPSLTIAGMVLAGAATWVYLRRKRQPALALLDIFAAPGALLAAFLELGHWLDQSEIGMPVERGGKVVGFQPVALYGVVLALCVLGFLWRAADRARPTGRVASLALMLGGAIAFGLDMVTLPPELFSNFAVEPGQIVALATMLAGALLWTFAGPRATPLLERIDTVSVPAMAQGEGR